MASSLPLRIEDEVISLELTGQREGLEPPFSLDWQLDLALARGKLSDESLASVRTLCGLLDSAGSAVVGTSHAGSDETSTALYSCFDFALKAKRDILHVKRESNSPNTPLQSRPLGANAKTAFPTVLIIFRTQEHGKRVSDTLGCLVQQFHLPIRCVDFVKSICLPESLEIERHGSPDIMICSPWDATKLMSRHWMCLDMTRLVLWSEAPQLFGSKFRR